MPRISPGWTLKKGAETWHAAEQLRLSPPPKLGGWAGKQLRFLSVSRGQSVITDVERGTLAINRGCAGLPSIQRMWFHGLGYSLGYTKPRGSSSSELFFFNSEGALWGHQHLPAGSLRPCPELTSGLSHVATDGFIPLAWRAGIYGVC